MNNQANKHDQDRDDLTIAQDVLQKEADALLHLSRELPADFQAVIEAILKTRGRVVVTGIGKSGHVARKFSATLASTGTPSQYVHPSEASHGDLGMISAQDLVIALSNSGETMELRDIIHYTKRFGIALVGVSSVLQSSLMESSDLKLILPKVKEACAIGMAPTSSTTMMMALGDALAIALMERRNFREENFQTLHPGGQLGAQLTTIGQLMHGDSQIPIVNFDTPMKDALIEMSAKGFGTAVVTQNGRMKGVISDGDLRRHIDNLMTQTAGEIASINPVTAPTQMLASEALALMNEHKISVLVIVDENSKPVGILHIHDLLRIGVV